jgi:hypothetical protein
LPLWSIGGHGRRIGAAAFTPDLIRRSMAR